MASATNVDETMGATASATAPCTAASAGVRHFHMHQYTLSSPELQAFHDRVATIATWYIETADAINTSDPKWIVFGLWEVCAPAPSATSEAVVGGGSAVDSDASGSEGSSSGSEGCAPTAAAASATSASSSAASPSPSPSCPSCAASSSAAVTTPVSYNFVGYATAYIFTNPFEKSDRKDIVRLAQMLILPPYQRQGHGSRFMDALLGLTYARNAKEFTVESPCKGMSRLRDVHDVTRACMQGVLASAGLPGWGAEAWRSGASALRYDPCTVHYAKHDARSATLPSGPLAAAGGASSAAVTGGGGASAGSASPVTDGAMDASTDTASGSSSSSSASVASGSASASGIDAKSLLVELPSRALKHIKDLLRITDAQAHRLYETLLLSRIDGGSEEEVRAYRLLVKKRMLAGDEELRSADAETRKAVLEDEYQQAYREYAGVLRRCGLMPASVIATASSGSGSAAAVARS